MSSLDLNNHRIAIIAEAEAEAEEESDESDVGYEMEEGERGVVFREHTHRIVIDMTQGEEPVVITVNVGAGTTPVTPEEPVYIPYTIESPE